MAPQFSLSKANASAKASAMAVTDVELTPRLTSSSSMTFDVGSPPARLHARLTYILSYILTAFDVGSSASLRSRLRWRADTSPERHQRACALVPIRGASHPLRTRASKGMRQRRQNKKMGQRSGPRRAPATQI